MELTILTKEQYQVIISRFDELNNHLKNLNSLPKKQLIVNNDFMKLLNISKRTAQTWRDEGKISFSQIGNKIYYTKEDIDEMIENNTIKGFKLNNHSWKSSTQHKNR